MIDSLKIQNFKCFLDETIKFRKLTLLAGENACGKSTIIQALLLLAQCRNSVSIVQKEEKIDFLYLDSGKNTLRYLIQLNNEFKLQLGSFREISSKESSNDRICFTLFNDKTGKFKAEFIEEQTHASAYTRSNDYSSDFMTLHNIFGYDFQYLNAERIGPRNIQELCTDRQLHVGYSGEYTNHVLLEKFEDTIDENKLYQKFHKSDSKDIYLYKQVQFWLDYLVPGIELDTKKIESIYRASTLIRRKGFTEDFLNPNNIGFGISYVLPIIVSALSISKNTLLIIENPEAHLHPKAQSRLGEFFGQMVSAGIQVIIETHSDHIINGIRKSIINKVLFADDALINFHSADSDGHINIDSVSIGADGEVNKWPEGFMDQSRIDLKDMLEYRLKQKN